MIFPLSHIKTTAVVKERSDTHISESKNQKTSQRKRKKRSPSNTAKKAKTKKAKPPTPAELRIIQLRNRHAIATEERNQLGAVPENVAHIDLSEFPRYLAISTAKDVFIRNIEHELELVNTASHPIGFSG